MIDPRETRIGNLVECYDIESDVWCIDAVARIEEGYVLTKDEVEAGVQTNEDIRPIPITPEWLERAGLPWSIFHQGHANYLIRVMGGYKGIYWLEKNDNWHYKIVSDLQYVHQLQNLYFALTGDELEIKMP